MRRARAVFLAQSLDFLGDARTLQDAEFFGQLKSDAARNAFQTFAFFQLLERAEQFLDMLRQPQVEPLLDLVQGRAGQLFVRQQSNRRGERARSRRDLCDGFAEPTNSPVIGERECVVDSVKNARGARFDLSGERLLRGCVQGLGRFSSRLGVGGKPKSLQLTYVLTFDQNVSGSGNFGL